MRTNTKRDIIITFDVKIELPSSILFHFIRTYRDRLNESATTFVSIPLNRDPIRLFRSEPFDLIFLELSSAQTYYLAIAENSHSDPLERKVTLPDRCPSVSEIVFVGSNPTIHLPERLPRSFLVSSTKASNELSRIRASLETWCLGQNGRENSAPCFQNGSQYPQTSTCIYPQCFYGRRCHSRLSHLTECLASTTIYSDSNHFNHYHRHDAGRTDERNFHFQEQEDPRSRLRILSSRIFDEYLVDHDDVRSEILSSTGHTDAVGQ